MDEVLKSGRKRKRTTMNDENNPISCIEDLSNELLYEIFEYFDADVLYEAFGNLNSRFQHLLFHSTFPLKVRPHSRSKLKYYCKNFWIPNKHRIVSIYFDHYSLMKISLAHCMIDSSFHRLESVDLNELEPEQFIMLLFYLKFLPRLASLDAILLDTGTIGLGNIYRMIFSLPTLKYNKLTLDAEKDLNISLPFAINESFSTIEYLNINHDCTVRQLFSIIHHTPQLHHLVCKILIGSETVNEQLVTLSNLKYLSIRFGLINLPEFESTIRTLSSHVETLNIEHCIHGDCLGADRWERMIKNHMTHVQKFNYKYHIYDDSEYLENVLYLTMNHFTSPFWTEQQWFFEVGISTDVIAYSISSHKKRWFDDYERGFTLKQQSTNKSSTKRTTNIQLIIHEILPAKDQLFFTKHRTVFVAVPFTDLEIDYPTISTEMLVKIVQLLPNLDSLKISSLQIHPPLSSNVNLIKMCELISTNNKITKVSHRNIMGVKQVDFLLSLCPRMEHFQIHLSQTINLDSFLRYILRKDDTLAPQLRSLCFHIPNASEITTHQLRNQIESESLLSKYTIKRCGDYVHLQWD